MYLTHCPHPRRTQPLDTLRRLLLMVSVVVLIGPTRSIADPGSHDGDNDHDASDVVVPPAPCHPNATLAQDVETVAHRGDIVHLPDPLRDRLIALAARPHSVLPVQARAEADAPSQLFQYYLLDTHGFEQNVFTSIIPGVNDQVMLTVTGADCGLPTIGSVRLVLEPKPGLPTNPSDPRAFIDVFTDIDPIFVINNESGWY